MNLPLDKKPHLNGTKKPDDDVVCVLCMPAVGKAPVAGSSKRECEKCGVAIWVSPATLAGIAKFPKKKFMCVDCVSKEAQDDLPEFMPPTPQQIDELRQALDNPAEADDDEELP
jgi:hypothetical protein